MVIETSSAEETREVGSRIGHKLNAGDILALTGTLGTGKTTLIQGIAKGLEIPDNVTSPTFTLINEYQGTLPMYHIDLYRLEDLAQIEDLGLFEYFKKGGITIIEWAEKLGDALPPDILKIEMSYLSETKRRLLLNFDI